MRRTQAVFETAERRAGIDVNVSNVTVASHVDGSDLRITRVERDSGERKAARDRAKAERRRLRALDRSRRAANPEQYEPSARQQKRARRLEEAGIEPRTE